MNSTGDRRSGAAIATAMARHGRPNNHNKTAPPPTPATPLSLISKSACATPGKNRNLMNPTSRTRTMTTTTSNPTLKRNISAAGVEAESAWKTKPAYSPAIRKWAREGASIGATEAIMREARA